MMIHAQRLTPLETRNGILVVDHRWKQVLARPIDTDTHPTQRTRGMTRQTLPQCPTMLKVVFSHRSGNPAVRLDMFVGTCAQQPIPSIDRTL